MSSQRWLSLNYLSFFFTWGIFMPYWTGWLTNDKGLSVPAASLIMGAGFFVRAFSTLILFPMVTRKYSFSVAMKALAVLSFFIILFYIPFDSYEALFIITLLFSLVYPNILPAVESSGTLLMNSEKIHYGKSRSFGSVGYTVALVLVGVLTEIYSESSILWLMIIGLIFIVLTQFQPTPASLRVKPKEENSSSEKMDIKRLLSSGGFLTVLVLAILLQGSHTSYYNYGFIYLQDLGVNGFRIGFILNFAVLSEIVIFAIMDKYFAKYKVSTMFMIAAIGSTVRWILIFPFPNTFVFILSQAFHSLSFGFAHYAFIKYISKNLNPKQVTIAQGMYSAFAMSLITAILTMGAGYLYEASPQFAFLGMLVCSVPAMILILSTKKRFQY